MDLQELSQRGDLNKLTSDQLSDLARFINNEIHHNEISVRDFTMHYKRKNDEYKIRLQEIMHLKMKDLQKKFEGCDITMTSVFDVECISKLKKSTLFINNYLEIITMVLVKKEKEIEIEKVD
jgi:hypothetical protein